MIESTYISKISYMFNYFFKHFGFVKTVKGIFFYNYRIFRRQFLDLTKDRILIINGYPFSIIPNDKGISEELLMFRTHEPLSTKLLFRLLEKGMYCLDLGSNIGYYACLESNVVGKNGKVIAIEPSPINFKYLEKNTNLQKFHNITTFNFACGDKDGKINLGISDRSNWSRVLTNDLVDSPPDKVVQTVNVLLRKIDSFLDEQPIKKLDFLRMDVEGYESNIIEGCKKTLEKYKPLIHMEIHLFLVGIEKTKQLLKTLQNYGYEVLYYIPREMDVPMLGNMNDVKKTKINHLIVELDKNTLPMNFIIFLKNKSSL